MCVHLVYLVGARSPEAAWLSAVTPRLRCLLPALRVPRALGSGGTSQPFLLLVLFLCAHPWFIATNQKPCALGQEPLCSQEPLQRARGPLGRLSTPPTPTATRLAHTHRLTQVSFSFCLHLPDVAPICKKGFGKSVNSVPKGRPPNHTWMQADGSPAMRGPTLARLAQQQLTGVSPCMTDQPESGCQDPRGEAQTDLTAGLQRGPGDPHSAGGSP